MKTVLEVQEVLVGEELGVVFVLVIQDCLKDSKTLNCLDYLL